MTPKEAKDALLKAMPDFRIRVGLDFGSFYAFGLTPKKILKDAIYESGPYLTAIDKKTGKVYDYDIRTDPDAYLETEEI